MIDLGKEETKEPDIISIYGISGFGRSVIEYLKDIRINHGNIRFVNNDRDSIRYFDSSDESKEIHSFNDAVENSQKYMENLISTAYHEGIGITGLSLAIHRLDLDDADNMSIIKLLSEAMEKQDVHLINMIVVPLLNDSNREEVINRIKEMESIPGGLLVMFSDNIIGMHGYYRPDIIEKVVSEVVYAIIESFRSVICMDSEDYRNICPKGKLRYVGIGKAFGINSVEISFEKALLGVEYDSSILFEKNEGYSMAYFGLSGEITLNDACDIQEIFGERYSYDDIIFSANYVDGGEVCSCKTMIIMQPVRRHDSEQEESDVIDIEKTAELLKNMYKKAGY